LAEVLQGMVALCVGTGVAFYFGWKMAPVGLGTAAAIVIIQLILTGYLKRRAQIDIKIAEEASRVSFIKIKPI
jgi:ATP-binding cassette subfamily B (MDR/TAP) protein 1